MTASSIGVFDSGIGGLTVLRVLAGHLPRENFTYLGDTARLPYGTKSPSTIRNYCEQVMEFFAGLKVKAIVIACNSASSQVLEESWKGIPVYGVIKPGAAAAVQATRNKRVAVLGTRATIESGIYEKEIKNLDGAIEVVTAACPLFVSLAEENWADDPVTVTVARKYLTQVASKDIDTVVLGCTHYPLLKNAIETVFRERGLDKVKYVDSGNALTSMIEKEMRAGKFQPANSNNQRIIKILKTDLSESGATFARQILKDFHVSAIEKVDL